MMVEQFFNRKTGNSVLYHFVIFDGHTKSFQSYNKVIATFDEEQGLLTIGKNWGFTCITTQHFVDWLSQLFDRPICKQDVVDFLSGNIIKLQDYDDTEKIVRVIYKPELV